MRTDQKESPHTMQLDAADLPYADHHQNKNSKNDASTTSKRPGLAEVLHPHELNMFKAVSVADNSIKSSKNEFTVPKSQSIGYIPKADVTRVIEEEESLQETDQAMYSRRIIA